MPARTGKLKDLAAFDATFFGVHAKQAEKMDPQLRLLLETTHETIIDAGKFENQDCSSQIYFPGFNPAELRGSRTGVYIGVSSSEAEEFWLTNPDHVDGYALTGCCRAMFPNRISFSFHFTGKFLSMLTKPSFNFFFCLGPSLAVDTACSSSLVAMSHAITAIRSGECDAAIVGGVNLLLKPSSSLQFHRLSMLSPDGACKAFDKSGNGYVRSEAAATILLQRQSAARRIYATVVAAKCNTDGYKSMGITFPNGDMQKQLLREVYDECGVDPRDISYVEAHGTGTKV